MAINTSGLRPFQKGQSGNPGGVAKVEAAFRSEVKHFGLAAIRRIAERAVDPNEDADIRFRADQFLVSYAFAKPPQTIEGNLGGAGTIIALQVNCGGFSVGAIEHEPSSTPPAGNGTDSGTEDSS